MTIQELQEKLDQFYAQNALDDAYTFLMEQVRIAMEKQDNPALLFLLNEMIGYFRVTSKVSTGKSDCCSNIKYYKYVWT